jgi:excisionase family DNA binding protein
MASADQTTLTRREAAELLGTSERNVRRLIELGRLPVHPGPKGARLLQRDDVLRYRARTVDAVPQEQAARLLDVDVRTVRRMLKDGRLGAIEMESGRLRVSRPSLDSRLADDSGQADVTGHPDETGH